MSAPAAPNTSQVNGQLTIDLDSDPTTFKWPLILGKDDAQAEAMRPWGLNMERNAVYATRQNPDFVIVASLVSAAVGGRYVVLRKEDAIHVYLLGWDWSREAFGEVPGREKGPLPQGDRLRRLLAPSLDERENEFLQRMLEDKGSIAWMQGVLRAVAAALKT